MKPRRSTSIVEAVLGPALVLPACGEAGAPSPSPSWAAAPVPAAASGTAGVRPRFEDVTGMAGIRFTHENGAFGRKFLPETMGSEVAFLDYDGDEWPDLFVANDTQPNLLLVNTGGGGFRDTALEAGVAFDETGRTRAGMGVGEMLGPDGRVVLAVGNFSREALSFFSRYPSGLFVDRAPVAGLAGPTLPALTFGLAFLDYDLDGRDDLVLANGHIEPTIREVQQEVTWAQPPLLFRNLPGRAEILVERGKGLRPLPR